MSRSLSSSLVLALVWCAPGFAASWPVRARHIAAVAVCATQAADALTSWRDAQRPGLIETNGLYAAHGRLEVGRLVAVKAAICGGFALAARFERPSARDRIWAAAGAGVAGATGAAAIRNLKVR